MDYSTSLMGESPQTCHMNRNSSVREITKLPFTSTGRKDFELFPDDLNDNRYLVLDLKQYTL